MLVLFHSVSDKGEVNNQLVCHAHYQSCDQLQQVPDQKLLKQSILHFTFNLIHTLIHSFICPAQHPTKSNRINTFTTTLASTHPSCYTQPYHPISPLFFQINHFMTTSSSPSPSIIITSSLFQLSSKQYVSLTDDYLRFVTSPGGKYLASISVKRKMTLFDLENNAVFGNWTDDNLTHLAFAESEDRFVIVTRTPAMKLYGIVAGQGSGDATGGTVSNANQTTTTKTVTLLKEIKPSTTTTLAYGWTAWSLDNKFVYYIKNDQIYSMNVSTYEESLLTTSVQSEIKSKCAPYYLLIDRGSKHLISSSKNGVICMYSVSASSSSSSPTITLLQTTRLSTTLSLTIADLNQGNDFIMASTSVITQNKQTYYCTYIISKTNLNLFSRIKLQQELISPPLMIQSDNVHNYIVSFLKGERSVYVFNVNEVVTGFQKEEEQGGLITSDESLSDDIKVLEPVEKLTMPYLLHTINYNQPSKQLLFGVSGTSNEDKIMRMDFLFNCSQIYQPTSISSTNQTTQLKQLCTSQCQSSIGSQSGYFSFLQGKCQSKTNYLINAEKACKTKGLESGQYVWDQLGEQCELLCENVKNSGSVLSFGEGEQKECSCQQNYVWSLKEGICSLVQKNVVTDKDSVDSGSDSVSNNTTTKDNSSVIVVDPVVDGQSKEDGSTTNNNNNNKNNNNNSTNNNNGTSTTNSSTSTNSSNTSDNSSSSQSQQASSSSSSSTAIALSLVFGFLLIGVAIALCFYKKKMYCFKKRSSQVEDNELKESDIRSSQAEEARSDSNSSKSGKQGGGLEKNSSMVRRSARKLSHDRTNRDNNNGYSNNQKDTSSRQQKMQVQSPIKIFNMNDNIAQPVDQFVIEDDEEEDEAKKENKNNHDHREYGYSEDDGQVDSERKF